MRAVLRPVQYGRNSLLPSGKDCEVTNPQPYGDWATLTCPLRCFRLHQQAVAMFLPALGENELFRPEKRCGLTQGSAIL